ncbi:MAG: magnesium transporter [Bacteroidales bacterium]|jgi:magnesium transporter|nr:magnesium transporter [Bacteroidales bacterium]NLK53692.1 magnesium transporter [Bacteroidales bacterium]
MLNFDVKALFRYIRKKSWKELQAAIDELDNLQLAEAINRGSEFEVVVLFRFLSREQAKEVFQELSHDKQEEIVNGLAQHASKVAELLNDMEPDDRTAFLGELPGEVAQRLMQLLTPDNREVATRLLGYPEDSIGRLMTPEYVAVKPHFTVEETLAHIRKYGRDSETLNVIYVVDDNWKLIDDIRIREVILASPEQCISDLIDYKFTSLNAFDDQETAVSAFKMYDRVVLPVLDTAGTLLGIVTIDDVFEIAEEEETEDFHKFGALQDAIISPLQASVSFLYKKRMFWLTALVFVNVFSGAIIQNFENVLERTLSLVFFLPLLIGCGGNAGSQSATLMIRALAMGDVEIRDWTKLLGKEFLVSLLLGLTMALAVSFLSAFRAPEIMLVLAVTMILIVITGSLIGMLLPFLFTRLKIDPATASAPLITSLADILGVLIYFTVASRMLGF